MQMLLDVEESKASFIMEWLNNFSFVKTQPISEKKSFLLQETKTLTCEKVEKNTLFAETRGMWAGRDFDIKKIRKEIRERRTKYYDNATL